jgi:hypothetical protein
MSLQNAAAILSEINAEAVRDAAWSLAAERGADRVRAMEGGPGRAPSPPKPLAGPTPPPAPPAPAAQQEKPVGWGGQRSNGWDARRSTSMNALDAARRQREGKGRTP